jgi:hypothetical protein
LVEVDNRICEHLGETPDEVKYAHYWYDIIGFKLALGRNWDDIRKDFAENVAESPQYADEYAILGKIVDFLEANYDTNAFYSPFK